MASKWGRPSHLFISKFLVLCDSQLYRLLFGLVQLKPDALHPFDARHLFKYKSEVSHVCEIGFLSYHSLGADSDQ